MPNEIGAAIDGVIANAEGKVGAVEIPRNILFISQRPVHIDQVFGSIVDHHDMLPLADGQFIAIAGVHIRYASCRVGSKNRFAVARQGDLPAFLPAAEGEQICLPLRRQFVGFHPETNGSQGRVVLDRIGNQNRIGAGKAIGIAAKTKAVGRQLSAAHRSIVFKLGHIISIAGKWEIGYQVSGLSRGSRFRRVQIGNLLGSQGDIIDFHLVQGSIKVAAAVNGVITHTQRVRSRIEVAGHIFFIGQGAIDINQVFGSIVNHDDLLPYSGSQFIAVAGIHIGNASGSVGSEDGFAMARQRNLPPLLPTAEGKQEHFTLSG